MGRKVSGRAVERGEFVPGDEVSGPPMVAVDEARRCDVAAQEPQHRVALRAVEPDDMRGVAGVDKQRLAAGFGVGDHQRPFARTECGIELRLGIRPVLRQVDPLLVAIGDDVHRLGVGQPFLHHRRQRVVGGAEAGKGGVAADRRDHLGAQHRHPRQERGEGRIAVPAVELASDAEVLQILG
jgi:hypothetical protein